MNRKLIVFLSVVIFVVFIMYCSNESDNNGEGQGNSNVNNTVDTEDQNNTGNQNFTSINITAYDLVGQIYGYQYVPAENLYINITDNLGQQLANNTMTAITSASLPRDIQGVENNQNLYLWIITPSTNLAVQNYTSSSDWVIEVYP